MQAQEYRIELAHDFLANFADRSFASDALIREIIVNAFEADATRLDISILHNGDLVFLDNGSGMDEEEFKEFWIIGFSRKKGTFSPRFHRPRAGLFGIGKVSLFKAFRIVKVQAHQGDFDATLQATRDSLVTMKVLKMDDPRLQGDGTRIALIGKLAQDPLFTEEGLASYIQSRLSHLLASPGFEIYVNRRKVEPLSARGLKTTITVEEEISEYGKITGIIEVMRRGSIPKEIQGIQVTVRGGAIGRRSLFGAELVGLSPQRITGWLEAEFLEPAILYSREGFDEASPAYEAFYDKIWEMLERDVKPAMEAQERLELSAATALAYREAIKRLARALLKERQYVMAARELVPRAREEQRKELTDAMEVEPPTPLLYATHDQTKSVDKEFEVSEPSTRAETKEIPAYVLPEAPTIEEPKELETEEREEITVPTPRAPPSQPQPAVPSFGSESEEITTQPEGAHPQVERSQEPLKAEEPLSSQEPLVQLPAEQPRAVEPTKPPAKTPITKKLPARAQIKPRRIGGWLIDFIELDEAEPVLRQGGTIYLNLKHPSYAALAKKRDALVYHLTRLVTQELAKDRHERAEEAFQAQDRLITRAIVE